MDRKAQEKLNKKKIKEYKKQLKSEIFDVSNELKFNDEGEAIIECKLGEPENLFSKYDIAKDRTIDEEFNEYLLEETKIIPLRYNLEVKMHTSEDYKEETKTQIRNAMKRYYSFNLTGANVELKKNTWSFVLLYFIGLVLLFLTPFAYKIETTLPVYELILILIWFCIWEASDIVIFKCGKIRNQRINMLRLYNAKITFIKDTQIIPKTTVFLDKATIITDKSTVYAGKSSTKEQNGKLGTKKDSDLLFAKLNSTKENRASLQNSKQAENTSKGLQSKQGLTKEQLISLLERHKKDAKKQERSKTNKNKQVPKN